MQGVHLLNDPIIFHGSQICTTVISCAVKEVVGRGREGRETYQVQHLRHRYLIQLFAIADAGAPFC